MIYTVKKLNKYNTWRILEVQKYCSEKLFWTEIVFKKQSCLKNSKAFVVSLTVKIWQPDSGFMVLMKYVSDSKKTNVTLNIMNKKELNKVVNHEVKIKMKYCF
jgi:hypothetical protein